MTREDINRDPRTWLNFYPHETFVALLRDLLASLDGGDKSIWLTGAYGTGKSHAALVLQKLFMDDESRVKEYLEKRAAQIPEAVRQALFAQRNANTLVVFDTKGDGLTTPEQFLVRIENTIIQVLKEKGCKIPVFGSLERILERIAEEEVNFFKKRDELQGKLCNLTPDITSMAELKKAVANPALQSGLLSDIMTVLHARDIYINLTEDNLLQWINEILKVNNIAKMVFIWDEFSAYIDQNRSQLTTFQEVANAAQQGKFFFIPVTHMKLESYLAAGSESAKKVNDRFKFHTLDMPTHTALLLAADAFKVINASWPTEQSNLWHAISPVVTNYMAAKDAECKEKPENFKGILPIHPMAAFVLKFLSTAVGSNQRSMFNFLKGEIGESEFQTFIAKSGPELKGRQFLTVDYLWHYFIERDDLGVGKEVNEVRIEFSKKSPALKDDEIRVFKAVLLYSLLGRLTPNGHELIQPTLENIKRCFEGDSAVTGVDAIAKELEKKHCFSIINGRCEMFRAMGDSEDIEKQIQKLKTQFNEQVLSPKAQPKLESKVKTFKDKLHFEVRAASVDKVAAVCQRNKELFGSEGNKILLQFIIAKDAEEQLLVADKAKELSKLFSTFRMLFIAVPELHFCSMKATYWDEYVEQLAHLALATDQATKTNYTTQINLMDSAWLAKLISPGQKLMVCKPNASGGDPFVEERAWNNLEGYLKQYLKESFECFVDDLSDYNLSAMQEGGKGLAQWAKAGMDFNSAQGANQNIVKAFARHGITGAPEWFGANPTHPLTRLRDVCKDKLNNALSGPRGTCSIRKIFLDIQRAPFGLLAVPYTAFVLGFVMKEWLNNPRQQLQWTNGSLSEKLDNESLAEMIDMAIKSLGDTFKNEKEVCRISKEEKKFIESAPTMFGIERVPNATVEGTLGLIAQRLEKISEKAPLWVLPDYIYAQEEPQADNCKAVIDDLCEAQKISSRGNQQERSDRIKAIGKRLQETDGLAELFSKFITPEIFGKAFRMRVNRAKPTLAEWAAKVGDASEMYCKIVKDHFAETASWLWNPQNVDDELDLVEAEYKVISVVQGLLANTGYIPFEDAMKRVRKAVYEDNKISVELLTGDYPVLTRILQVMDSSKIADGLKDLAELFNNHKDLLKKLFFDPARSVQLELLKKHFDAQLAALGTEELRKLYEKLSCGARRTADDFKKTAFQEIDDYLKASTVQQLLTLWTQKTQSGSPAEWSSAHKMPSAVLFASAVTANEIIAVLSNPAGYQSGILKKVKKELESAAITPSEQLPEKFLKMLMPGKYANLSVDAGELGEYLCRKVGKNPDSWLLQGRALTEAVDGYVRERYAAAYKSQAVDKVKAMSNDDAKKVLLKFAADNPDVGLKILE